MGFFSSYGVGRYVASEGDVLWIPQGYKGDGTKRGVVYAHGAGELANTPLNAGQGANPKQNEAQVLAAIASVYPMVSFDGGVFGQGGTSDSNSWGNTNAQTRLGQAITWLQTAPGAGGWSNPLGGGAKTGPVILVGFSMGHLLSLTYGSANPTNVSCIVGILPVNDPDDIRDNNRGGFQASISTAWGTGAWVSPGNPPLPNGANPLRNALSWIQIPQLVFAANDDLICTIATCNALAAKQGPLCTLVNMGNSGGHSDTSIGAASIPQILAFMARFA